MKVEAADQPAAFMMTSMGDPLQAAAEVQADRVLCALKSSVHTCSPESVSHPPGKSVFTDRVMRFLITEKELPLPLPYIFCPVEVLSQHCHYAQFAVARVCQEFNGGHVSSLP